MSKIRPFRAFRPLPDIAAKVASVPYDVINTKEARELSRDNPFSFLHICRPEIDLTDGIDIHSDKVYEKGAENLRAFIAGGTLFREDSPAYYIYQQRMGNHVQAGLVVCSNVQEYEKGLIKIHELTRKDKEDDRTRHVSTQNANAEPVFLTYRAVPELDSIIERSRRDRPVYDFTSVDGIGHAVWVLKDPALVDKITELMSKVDALYVADGHHRTAAAVRNGQAARSKSGGRADDTMEHEWFMAVLFPHNQLRIMGYYRVVKDLNGLSERELLAHVGDKFSVGPGTREEPASPHHFGMYLDKKWYELKAKEGSFQQGDPILSLDVSILQNNLLDPILGIKDPRTDKRIDFVGGIRGTGELEKRCHDDCKVAFSLAPVTLEQLMAVADAGKIMPPKSTWFEPKLRSGLTVRVL
ncbi:MAG: hypothetical protein A2583_15875 [Bdellovibrionales bacterium RIFOXYD1_FULL_53_11]|nr:MAG: hypothetical protein A2583_15875 [Bdellovibrionales bacterium RIFOXYD1_FULL_53_11]